MEHDQKVREFYDSALYCYESIMGDRWHHGDPDAEARGMSVLDACQVIEEKVVALSGLKAGGRALDFGCGIGGPTMHMAKVSGAKFVGVTNNQGLQRRASERAAAAQQADQVQFLAIGDTDYQSFPDFAEGSFDAVTFYESVCHLFDKAAFFRAVFRVLKPGGRLVGTDWMQRPFGAHQNEEQIAKFIKPVNDSTAFSDLGSVPLYHSMLREAGFQVTMARDLFEGVKCWGTTPDYERPQWLNYEGPGAEMFRTGKAALDEAREAGVFTVGMFVAEKPV
ncbi:MAG: methyltransferase domain-containing protein [Polyangiaceae bacterium]